MPSLEKYGCKKHKGVSEIRIFQHPFLKDKFKEVRFRDINNSFKNKGKGLHHKSFPVWHYLERCNEQLHFSFPKRCFHYKRWFPVPEQIQITPSPCSLLFGLEVPVLDLFKSPRSPFSCCSTNQSTRNEETEQAQSSVPPGASWFSMEDIDLKGLKQSIATFNNIIPEEEPEPKIKKKIKQKNKSEWLYLVLQEMQLPPWHGCDYKIG